MTIPYRVHDSDRTMSENEKIIFLRTINLSELKLYMNNHGNALYKIQIFCVQQISKMANHHRPNLT